MKKTNSELKTEFKNYIQENGWNVENLEKIEKVAWDYSLKIFDVFFDWILNLYANWAKEYKTYVVNKLSYTEDRNFSPKTEDRIKIVFGYFVKFFNKNKSSLCPNFFDKCWSTIVTWFNWDDKVFLEKWHKYIINDEWKNKDKFGEYLFDIYNQLGFDNKEKIYKFYSCLSQAHRKLYEINSRNKEIQEWKLSWEKQDAFDIASDYLRKKLYELNLSDQEWKVRSIFGKYLNFIPKYREELKKNLEIDANKTKENIDKTKKSIIPVFEFNWNFWIEWDWFWPIVVKNQVRGNDWYYDETERGDIIAPIDYGYFNDESENDNEIVEEDEKKTKKTRKRTKKWDKNQIDIDFWEINW